MELHAADAREHLYGRDALEQAEAAEDVWNAAQRQLVRQGKMHGFMRMSVWKSTSASGALRRAVRNRHLHAIEQASRR